MSGHLLSSLTQSTLPTAQYVGPVFGKWLQTQTELTSLRLRNTGISDFLPKKWFFKISFQLTSLDLSHNHIRGNLPSYMDSPSLEHIDLSDNLFEGPLPQWSSDAALGLDLRSNLFSGPILSNYDRLLPKLKDLFLSDNNLNGSIPPSLCNMSSLRILMLSGNTLSGEFPRAWSMWPNIWVVDVSDNNLSGNIPTSMGVPSSLKVLKLSNNSFGGQIPSTLFQNCYQLQSVDLGDNRFTGSIPLVEASQLYLLRLRSNYLSGEILQQLCHVQSLHILDLGNNSFSGNIPKCLYYLTALVYGDDTDFYVPNYHGSTTITWKGREAQFSRTLRLVNAIDFSSNHLEGVIPEEISSLRALVMLNLSRNQLTGNIPLKIGNMEFMGGLDLSHNHLFGQIPQSLSSLTFLSDLNLSFNNLSGRIPSGTQFESFSRDVYEGNPSLCGVPLLTLCPRDGDDNDNDPDEHWKIGRYVSAALGFFIGFGSVCGTLVMMKSWRYAYFRFFDNIHEMAALAIALHSRREISSICFLLDGCTLCAATI